MENIRAEILKVDFSDTAAVQISITATKEKIFNIIADPHKHQLFDGSGSLQGLISGPDRLYLGAKFGMAMKIKVPYRITNKVVTFEDGFKISWCHLMKWTWSYELQELGQGQVRVTERFDAHSAPRLAKRWLKITGAMRYNPTAMAKSLVRLKAICES
jgi:hypothetical protein